MSDSNFNNDFNKDITDNINKNVDIKNNIVYVEWNEDDDKILKEWIDKSACLKILHEMSYKKYKQAYFRQMIPVIIISTLTGAANFSIERLSQDQQKIASLVIGGFNILTGIISTISQFLKTSELKEGHNIATKSWDKFNRNIKIELQRNPSERGNKKELFTYSIKEFDRLIEISPDIPTAVIIEFRKQYKNIHDLIKPDNVDKIIPSKIYKVKEKIINDVIEEIIDPIEILKKDFINAFENKYKRQPTVHEIEEYIELKSITTSSA